MAKGHEIRAYAEKHGITDGEALKALSRPASRKDDTGTPRTDAVVRQHFTKATAFVGQYAPVAEALLAHAKQIERELTDCRAMVGTLNDRLSTTAVSEQQQRPGPQFYDTKGNLKDGPHYGNDCPAGMVQVEFVGVDPKLRNSPYGWKPSPSAFLDVWVDGKRFNLQLGDMGPYGHPGKRGLHVNYHYPAEVGNRSVNALTITLPDESSERPDVTKGENHGT